MANESSISPAGVMTTTNAENKQLGLGKSGSQKPKVDFTTPIDAKDWDLFLAEYNSLREEVRQRISDQTTVYQIAVGALGVILGIALEKMSDTHPYNAIYFVLTYPLLAHFLSYTWRLSHIRIGQIAGYIVDREKQASSDLHVIGWENHTDKLDQGKRWNKGKTAIPVLVGTQAVSLIVSLILFLTLLHPQGFSDIWVLATDPQTVNPEFPWAQTMSRRGISCFLLFDFIIMCWTWRILYTSEARRNPFDQNDASAQTGIPASTPPSELRT